MSLQNWWQFVLWKYSKYTPGSAPFLLDETPIMIPTIINITTAAPMTMKITVFCLEILPFFDISGDFPSVSISFNLFAPSGELYLWLCDVVIVSFSKLISENSLLKKQLTLKIKTKLFCVGNNGNDASWLSHALSR